MKYVIASILIVVLCFSIWRYWRYSTDYVGVDYYQLWMVGQYVKGTPSERVNFYRDEERIGSYFYSDFRTKLRRKYGDYILFVEPDRLPYLIEKDERKVFNVSEIRRSPRFYSTPFLFYFISRFSLDNYSNSFKLFSSVSLILFICGCFLLFRLLRFRPVLSAALSAAILLFYFPLARSQQSGNVNELSFFFFILYLYLTNRSDKGLQGFLAGASLAVSIAIKPLTVLVGIYELVMATRRKLSPPHLFLGILCAAFAIYIMTCLHYGFFIWTAWWQKIPSVLRDSLYYTRPMQIENYSILMTLKSVFHSKLITALFGYSLIPIGMLSIIYSIKKLRTAFHTDRIFATCILLIIALLIYKVVWPHYFVFLIIVFAAAVRNISALDTRLKKGICGASLGILFLVMTGFFRVGFGYYIFSFTPLLLGLLYIYTTYWTMSFYR